MINPIKLTTLLFCLFAVLNLTLGQEVQELNLEDGYILEKIIPCENDEFIVVSETENAVDKEYLVSCQLYNSSFEKIDESNTSYKHRHFYWGSLSDENLNTSLYSSTNYWARLITNSIEGSTLNTKTTEIRSPKKSYFEEPLNIVAGNGCMFQLENDVFVYAKNSDLVKFIKLNLISDELTTIELEFPEVKGYTNRVLGVQKLSEEEFAVVFDVRKSKKDAHLYVCKYTAGGELLQENKLENFPFVKNVSVGLVDGELVVGGLYGISRAGRAEGLFLCVPNDGELVFKSNLSFEEIEHSVNFSVIHELIISDNSIIMWVESYRKEYNGYGEDKQYLGNNYSSASFFSFDLEGKYQSKGKLGIEVGRVFDDNGLCEIVKNKEGNYFVWFSGQTNVSIYELQIGELIIDKVKSNEFNFYEKLTFGSNIKAAYCGDNNFFVYGFQQDKKTKSNRKNFVTKISID
jgi:hypothetical protein